MKPLCNPKSAIDFWRRVFLTRQSCLPPACLPVGRHGRQAGPPAVGQGTGREEKLGEI